MSELGESSGIFLEDSSELVESTAHTPLGTQETKVGTKPKAKRKSKTISNQVKVSIPKAIKGDGEFVLVEVEDPQMNLGGDTGVVGRFKTEKDTIVLDLKGSVYKGTMVPCHSMMVVSIGADTAKAECILNHYVPAQRTGNIFENETMVSGSLEFDANEIDIDADVNIDTNTTSKTQENIVKGEKVQNE